MCFSCIRGNVTEGQLLQNMLFCQGMFIRCVAFVRIWLFIESFTIKQISHIVCIFQGMKVFIAMYGYIWAWLLCNYYCVIDSYRAYFLITWASKLLCSSSPICCFDPTFPLHIIILDLYLCDIKLFHVIWDSTIIFTTQTTTIAGY